MSELDHMDAEEFDDWYLYFKLVKEESEKPPKKQGKSKPNSTTTYY